MGAHETAEATVHTQPKGGHQEYANFYKHVGNDWEDMVGEEDRAEQHKRNTHTKCWQSMIVHKSSPMYQELYCCRVNLMRNLMQEKF